MSSQLCKCKPYSNEPLLLGTCMHYGVVLALFASTSVWECAVLANLIVIGDNKK